MHFTIWKKSTHDDDYDDDPDPAMDQKDHSNCLISVILFKAAQLL